MALIAQSSVPLPIDVGVISDNFDVGTISTTDVIIAVSAIIGSVFLAHIVKRTLRRRLNSIDDMPVLAADVVGRITGYAIVVVGISIALEALGFSFGPLGSVLLLIVILVVLAARPLLQDLGAGLILQMRRPFHVGDQVVLDDVEGEIEEVSARTVRMITVDGRRVHLPNRSVLADTITNLTSEGRRLSTFVVGAAYSTNLDQACELIVTTLGTVPSVLTDPPPTAFVQEFAESTIDIACRIWHQPEIEAEWAARDDAMRTVKRALNEHGITIAFPQRMLWDGATDRSMEH